MTTRQIGTEWVQPTTAQVTRQVGTEWVQPEPAAAGGGGGFQSAWARNTNTVIQAVA